MPLCGTLSEIKALKRKEEGYSPYFAGNGKIAFSLTA